ncbi:hypothetical protein PIB30_090531 [Stylosanthes scabra]|uniref:Uncharacterized protein n=1 Tax=Stylosanthes scabra TaxID=79078 RepID=A0ABU6WSN4_9FABA|nr:hypothetical protein [Stylosanthes scabra]
MEKERRGREGGTASGVAAGSGRQGRESEVIDAKLFPVLLLLAGLALLFRCNFLVSQIRRNYHGIATMLLSPSSQVDAVA